MNDDYDLNLTVDQQGYLLENRVDDIASRLFAQACSRPIPVNEPEAKPDWAEVAKECVERAREVTPYLLRELGLLPKEGE